MIIEEEYFDNHYRALKVEYENKRLYSIDIYHRISHCNYFCEDKIDLNDYELCYLRFGSCEGVVIRSLRSGTSELISLRLKTNIKGDPAEGTISKARKICIREVNIFMESECDEFSKNKQGTKAS